ncbi:MAG: LptF/LptG family permease [Cyanobacteriota bacterium]
MKLLDKYLFTQVFQSFLFGLALLIIVWIAPELIPKVVRDVVADNITAYNGFLTILYELPEVIVKSLPMAMLIGALLAFDRMSKDSEITAMRSCGISIYRMLGSILLLGIAGTIIAFIINETIVPPTSLAQEKIINKGRLISQNFTFVDKDKKDILKQVILIENFDGSTINNIRIINFNSLSPASQNIKEIIAASTGKWAKDHWELSKGIAFRITSGGYYEDTIYFDNEKVFSNPNAYTLLSKSQKKAKNMNLFELKNYINALVNSHHSEEARYYKVRLHQKFSQPFAVIILGIVGVILGLHPPRSSRFVGYTVGMFVILTYYFLWPLTIALGNIGALPPLIAAWLPNVVATLIGLLILKYKVF